jgi:hypothetical protein
MNCSPLFRKTLLVVAIVAALAVGCGGSTSDSEASDADAGDTQSAATQASDAESSEATAEDGVLEGTYEITAPDNEGDGCTFHLDGSGQMVVSGDDVTIGESLMQITGTLAVEGDTVHIDAEQPGANAAHTITATVTDGGDTFTATDDLQSIGGTCTFEFSGERSSKNGTLATSTTMPSSPTTAVPPGSGGPGEPSDSSAPCDDPAVGALVREAHPGVTVELRICENNWAFVSYGNPAEVGSYGAAVLRFEGGSWHIVGNHCAQAELPEDIQRAACGAG